MTHPLPDLDRLVATVARQLATDDRQVAATVAWKRYSYTVGAPAMHALAVSGQVPDMSLANTVVTVHHGEPLLDVTVVEPRALDPGQVGLAAALEPLRAGHLWIVGDELARRFRVGRRGLDVMEHATLVSALAEASPPDVSFDRAAALLAALDPGGRRLVEIAELSRGEYRRPMALRSACCLVYKARDAGYCATCNLIDDAQRTAQLAVRGLGWRRLTPV